jgi:hypothetical protein
VGRVAKWIVTIVVGISAATITFLIILYFASTNNSRWTLAATGAGAILALSTAIGATWVNHTGIPTPPGIGNQTVSNNKIKSGSGPAAGIMGDVHINSNPPARRKARWTSSRTRS